MEIAGNCLKIKGPNGELTRQIPAALTINKDGNLLRLGLKKPNPNFFAVFGTNRAILANSVTGVSQGWIKKLELVGAGFRAEVSDKTLTLTVGYSHPVKILAPEGIDFTVEKTLITVKGMDKEVVGQIAAEIRAVRPPEPYKGKGIKYVDEVIRRKAGKAAKMAGAV